MNPPTHKKKKKKLNREVFSFQKAQATIKGVNGGSEFQGSFWGLPSLGRQRSRRPKAAAGLVKNKKTKKFHIVFRVFLWFFSVKKGF